MKKLKKDNKGFTLVEMIVVLVILAILAAILVPALLGYIDEAKDKQITLHGKTVYTAAQSMASKYYGKTSGNDIHNNADDKKAYIGDVVKLSEISEFGDGAEAVIYFKKGDTSKEAYQVTGIKYTESGKTMYMLAGSNEWTSTEPNNLENGIGPFNKSGATTSGSAQNTNP